MPAMENIVKTISESDVNKSALMTTWLLGLVIFIDDYLNALTVSSAMKKVTDKIGQSLSSGAFGSHACFYGDSTVLSAMKMQRVISKVQSVLSRRLLAKRG